jgi:hypothetical protein
VIQRRLQDPLALLLLDGTFEPGDTVAAGAPAGEIVLEKRAPAPAGTDRTE